MKLRFHQRIAREDEGRGAPRKPSALRTPLRALVLFMVIFALCASVLYGAKRGTRPSGPPAASKNRPPSEPRSFSPPGNGAGPSFKTLADGRFIEERGPYQLIYTVDPVLQASVDEVFRKYRPAYGVFVAMDPKTGRILALADYSREVSESGAFWKRATYPAASVFKIITAACALEKGVLNYDSSVSFRGNQYRLGPNKISKSSKWDQQTHFDEALGKSNNVVFGRVASKLVGPETLRQYCQAFWFNQPLPFDFPLERSRANVPDEAYELARCGAGFAGVTLNPLHAALIAACVAHDGAMMRPYLIETVRSGEEVLYRAKAEVLAQPISAKTAQDLNRMMRRTVEDGTAAKTFQRSGKELRDRIAVSGKTGSLTGDNPPGHYDWFVGFAPAEDPQIAFSAMIINQQGKLKGTFVAREALKVFFRDRLN
jgi:penicillin-binding protein A